LHKYCTEQPHKCKVKRSPFGERGGCRSLAYKVRNAERIMKNWVYKLKNRILLRCVSIKFIWLQFHTWRGL